MTYFMLKKRKTIYLPIILVMAVAFSALSITLVELAIMQRKVSSINQKKISALGVAEAGVSYYLWHLAHNNTDYSDGQSVPATTPYGPYIHDYYNDTGELIGTYSLSITPPPNGSTIVTVESEGKLNGEATKRKVKAVLGIPSFGQYAMISGSEMWFGETESTNGPVHSNVGVHMDGVNNGIVTAANATYVPTTQFGGNNHTAHNGVWGIGGPAEQWLFPVPAVDFQSVSTDLQDIKTKATANGKVLPKSNFLGYFIQFQADGTYKLAEVTSYSFANLAYSSLVSQPIPNNGVIYSEDNIWVEGTVKGKYTVVAAKLPSVAATNRDITITNNLTYTTKDGSDTLGLVAQRDVKVGPKTPDMFEINAAMLAQNGRVYRPCRWNDANPCWKANGNSQSDTYPIKNSITVYGSIGAFGYWNWSWVAGVSGTLKSGYQNTVQTFDEHLFYGPPPYFPSTGKYALLSWREEISP
jgi:hypothetical protein